MPRSPPLAADRTFVPVDRTSGVNRVPEVTISFWLVELMAVIMGETAADHLAVDLGLDLGLGLTATSLPMASILAGALVLQFGQKRSVPWSCWLAVVLIAIVGTLVTDDLVDNLGVSLVTTTALLMIALAATFAAWRAAGRTLSIHGVFTTRREAFDWVAILFTFAFGAAAGDLVAEQFGLGYLATGILFGMIIASITARYHGLRVDGILAVWIAHIFTRPIGSFFDDLISQPAEHGGLGLGTIVTSAIFLAVIVATVVWMTTSRGQGPRPA